MEIFPIYIFGSDIVILPNATALSLQKVKYSLDKVPRCLSLTNIFFKNVFAV